MSLNHDRDQPRNNEPKIPVSYRHLYDKTIKTYWIDGQKIDSDTLEYTFDEVMPRAATLHIPKVVRFIYTFSDADDISGELCGGTLELPCPPGEYLGYIVISVTFLPGDTSPPRDEIIGSGGAGSFIHRYSIALNGFGDRVGSYLTILELQCTSSGS